MLPGRDKSVQWQRHEAKYLIDEGQAARIRSFCRSHLPLDPYSARQPDAQYPILSIYLDSLDGQCIRGTLERRTDRFKLRVREYRHFRDPVDSLPAFFEIKRKSHGIVFKTRAKLDRETAHSLLWSDRCFYERRESDDAPTYTNINEFLKVQHSVGAKPTAGVFYTREAFESDSADRVRISFDRNLHVGLISQPSLGRQDMWWPVPMNYVILEIKFTNTFPFWVSDLIRRSEVMRRGVCKYVLCSQAAGIGPFRANAKGVGA